MNTDDILKTIERKLASEMFKLPAIITYELKSTEFDEDQVIARYSMETEWGKYKQSHSIDLVYNFETKKYGIDLGMPDGDLAKIKGKEIMTVLYFDLAFQDIDKKDFV